MNPLPLIRDIFIAPRKAYTQENLEGTLGASILAYVVLAGLGMELLVLGVFHNPAWHDMVLRSPKIKTFAPLWILVMMACTIGYTAFNAWVTAKVAASCNESVPKKSYMAGHLWSSTALIPVGWILSLVFGAEKLSGVVVLLWGGILQIICLQVLAKTSLKRASWIYFLSWLLVIVVPGVIIGVVGILAAIAIPTLMHLRAG